MLLHRLYYATIFDCNCHTAVETVPPGTAAAVVSWQTVGWRGFDVRSTGDRRVDVCGWWSLRYGLARGVAVLTRRRTWTIASRVYGNQSLRQDVRSTGATVFHPKVTFLAAGPHLHLQGEAELDMDRIHPWIGLDWIGSGAMAVTPFLISNHCSTVRPNAVCFMLWFMNV